MKRESSQTVLPVAVQEICSCHLESFVTGSVDNMLKQTYMPQRSRASLGLEMLSLPWDVGKEAIFGPHHGSLESFCPIPKVCLTFILSNAQETEYRRVHQNVV